MTNFKINRQEIAFAEYKNLRNIRQKKSCDIKTISQLFFITFLVLYLLTINDHFFVNTVWRP